MIDVDDPAGLLSAPTRGVCRVCGCTEARACDGGCSWLDDDQTVCTTATCVAAAGGPLQTEQLFETDDQPEGATA